MAVIRRSGLVLGISAYYHDAAAVLLHEGQVVAAAQEERFSRQKHDPSFPAQAIRYCLHAGHTHPDQLDAVVFYDKPWLTFERLLETYYAFAPGGLRSFVRAMPVWLRHKLFLKQTLRSELQALGMTERVPLQFTEHHLAHAASTFYPSPFEEAAVLTLDGVGEWATTSIFHGQGSELTALRQLHFPHSLGLMYSAATYYLGFRVNDGEYKVMGLAPYGDPTGERVQRYREAIEKHLMQLNPDGSFWLNQRFFRYATGTRMTHDKRWQQLFGLARRQPEEELQPAHADLALALQLVTEEVVLRLAATAKQLTGSRYLCLAGGVALNSVANGKLVDSGLFDQVFVQPAAGDAGGAWGAATAGWHIGMGQRRTPQQPDGLQSALLGPGFTPEEITGFLRRVGATARHYEQWADLYAAVADLLAQGMVVGWFQGRMEFGPRALGNRSILADPRPADMQQRLNLKIKHREGFRPFAPAVLTEHASDYFELTGESPYMLQVHPVRTAHRKPLPDGLKARPIGEQAQVAYSTLPAITHCDHSARIETVDQQRFPRFYALLQAFYQKTGTPMLVNTSLNTRGAPMACLPEDAYHCFVSTGMDVLVLDRYVLLRTEQDEAFHRQAGTAEIPSFTS